MVLAMKTINSTHANSKIRRRQIVEAALACFTEKGFTETAITDICRKAGASTGSVYHHFKSKVKLAAAIYLEGIGDYQAGMIAALSKQKSARDGIFTIIRYHLSWVEKNPDWARFLFRKRQAEYMNETEDEMRRLNASFVQGMSAWFQNHIKAGTIRPLPRDVFMALLLGSCQEFSRLYLSGYAKSDITEAAETLAGAAWACLGIDSKKGGGKS